MREKKKKSLIGAPTPSPRDAAIDTHLARLRRGAIRDILHEANVVEFRQMAIFLQIGSFMRGHTGEEAFDEVIRDEGVAEVEFGDVRLLG